MKPSHAVLFEPWNLGDAIIAFATALQYPDRIALACNSRWHSILSFAAQGQKQPALIPVDLSYVSRNNVSRKNATPFHRSENEKERVLSIRGDLRDYHAAKSLFPSSQLKMNGWLPFLAKRSALVDLPFRRSWLPVRNRYRAWADLAQVDWDRITSFYHQRRCSSSAKVAIHVGAQWKSKQYPHAAELVRILQKSSDVRVIAAPGDPLPPGLSENDVSRLIDGDLVRELLSCTHLVANDSGPMHLGALLRCRTTVLSNRAAMSEWLPPEVIAVQPINSPRGYHAPRLSDEVFASWPHPQQVVKSVFSTQN
ncbi:MAG: hypothetical protein JST28_05515 [Acidobacteria bacterium]|nr:hypothetical protein [Acidobacteriota bacterium]